MGHVQVANIWLSGMGKKPKRFRIFRLSGRSFIDLASAGVTTPTWPLPGSAPAYSQILQIPPTHRRKYFMSVRPRVVELRLHGWLFMTGLVYSRDGSSARRAVWPAALQGQDYLSSEGRRGREPVRAQVWPPPIEGESTSGETWSLVTTCLVALADVPFRWPSYLPNYGAYFYGSNCVW